MADLAAMINDISKAGVPSTSETILDAEETRAALLAMVNDAGSGIIAAGSLGPGSVATPIGGGPVSAGAAFTPFQVIWLLELTCDAAGSAIVTLTGVRRDTGASETIAIYSLATGETVRDANDRTDYASFSWSKTGSGNVTARVS